MFASKIRAGLERLAAQGYRDPVVVFTAHSLPKKLMEEGDPYERELTETMDWVLHRLGPLRTRMAWQTAGRTGDACLGPGREAVRRELARARAETVRRGP